MVSSLAERVQLLADDRLGMLCGQVLEDMRVGVVACDDSLRVLAATPIADTLLQEFRSDTRMLVGSVLPEPIRCAAENCLRPSVAAPGRRRLAPVRVESEDGAQALYVAAHRVEGFGPAGVAVRLQEERLADAEVFEALR